MRTYKFKKTDTPAKVAKSFGHRNFATIWNHQKNRPLKSKRKSETALVAGDTLSIPLNDAERKQILAEIEFWMLEVADEDYLRDRLASSILVVSAYLGKLTSTRAALQGNFKLIEKTVFGTIKVVRKVKEAQEIEKKLDIAAASAAKAMANVGKITKQAQADGAGIKKLLVGELKEVVKSPGVTGSEGKSAVGVISGFMDSVGEVTSKVTKEIGSAVTAKYWQDLLIYGDVELMDLEEAKSKSEKKLLQGVNNVRKSAALTDTFFKGMLATAKVKQKYLEMALSECKKRLKSAQARLNLLPKQSDLKKM